MLTAAKLLSALPALFLSLIALAATSSLAQEMSASNPPTGDLD